MQQRSVTRRGSATRRLRVCVRLSRRQGIKWWGGKNLGVFLVDTKERGADPGEHRHPCWQWVGDGGGTQLSWELDLWIHFEQHWL